MRINTDVLVIGAGPHSLAVTARLVEESASSFRRDDATEAELIRHRRRVAAGGVEGAGLRVRVLDESGDWLDGWKRNFSSMAIPHLRSRAIAHPDPSDPGALLSFASENGRWAELLQEDEQKVRGGKKRGRKRQDIVHNASVDDVVSYARPSSELFSDFCDHLASRVGDEIGDIIKCACPAACCVAAFLTRPPRDRALSVRRESDGSYVVGCNSCEVSTKAIVLACGHVGLERVPSWALHAPHPCIVHTQNLAKLGDLSKVGGPVTVVGSGMSGCWVALALANMRRPVTLVSRSGLRVQAYDTSVEWSGRAGARALFNFFSADTAERAELIREARGRGHGTVNPTLAGAVRDAVAQGRLTLVEHDDVESVSPDGLVLQSGRTIAAECIVLGTGVRVDCMASSLFSSVAEAVGGVKVMDGFPVVGDDLRLHPDHDIFVVGALGALGIGPHAHNLSGARTCSRLVADALVHSGGQDSDDEDHDGGGTHANQFAQLALGGK